MSDGCREVSALSLSPAVHIFERASRTITSKKKAAAKPCSHAILLSGRTRIRMAPVAMKSATPPSAAREYGLTGNLRLPRIGNLSAVEIQSGTSRGCAEDGFSSACAAAMVVAARISTPREYHWTVRTVVAVWVVPPLGV